MEDLVLITADSVRYDAVEKMEFVSEHAIRSGTTVAHYTRPSLAGLLSSRYRSSVVASVKGPTIPSVLSDAGYTTIGLAPSPQLDEVFGFNEGFDTYQNFVDAGNRGSSHREILGQFDILRKVYHRLFPPHAKMDDLPTDQEVADRAVELYNAESSPRFLWVHLMGSHRPYGRGDDAIAKELDRKALFAPDSLSESQQLTIREAYYDALDRVDDVVEYLHSALEGDPILMFTSDHGDEFGEEGYYFHQPQRCRTADKLVTVPVVSNGIELPDGMCSLLDIGPMLAAEAGVEPPTEWNGIDVRKQERTHTVTVAPWHNTASVRLSTPDYTLTSNDGHVALQENGSQFEVERNENTEAVQEHLRDLGYVE